MKSITVLTPGFLPTIQDLGRYGYQKYGVIVSGVMDAYSMRLANILVGNAENEAVIELTMMGPSLSLSKGSLISIAGANLSPTIDGIEVPMLRPIYIREACILKFGQCSSGCRCYVAAAGGFDIPIFMESKSTYLRAKIGGKDGRALKKDDVLTLGAMGELSMNIAKKLELEANGKDSFVFSRWHPSNIRKQSSETVTIRVFEDRQFDNVSNKSIKEFFNSSFSIDSKSDRMGYRLNGPKIELKDKIEMISEEVSFGTIQVPPDGNPIILLADRATAGGYPKIAHVASYDLSKLVQLKPGDSVKFKKIILREAEVLYLKRERYLAELKKSVEALSR